jgi:hypothetical protein
VLLTGVIDQHAPSRPRQFGALRRLGHPHGSEWEFLATAPVSASVKHCNQAEARALNELTEKSLENSARSAELEAAEVTVALSAFELTVMRHTGLASC